MEKLFILKIGGKLLDNEVVLQKTLRDFSKIEGKKILIHGGGNIASEISEQLGVIPKLVDGRRITDAATLKIVTMVYAGWVNKSVVAKLQALGCNAIGLTGADAGVIPATKRKVKDTDYGFVGDVLPNKIGTKYLKSALNNGLIPVFSAITSDSRGQLLNTNADTIASTLAIALKKYYASNVIYCFEKNGVLKEPINDDSVIHFLDKYKFDYYKKRKVISKGMIPKLDTGFDALERGVGGVFICGPDQINNVFALNYKGTTLCL